MAGDTYQVNVYLAYDRDKDDYELLDNDVEIDAEIKASSPTLQVWRKLHISRYIRKRNTIADLMADNTAWNTVSNDYSKAYITVEIRSNLQVMELDRNKYNTDLKTEITAKNNKWLSPAFIDPLADHRVGVCAAVCQSYAAMKTQARSVWIEEQFQSYRSNPANVGFSDLQLRQHITTQATPPVINNWLTTINLGSQDAYVGVLGSWISDISTKAVESSAALTNALDGVTIVEFGYMDTVFEDMVVNQGLSVGGITGAAISPVGSNANRCCFVGWVKHTQTLVHEVGHHLCLPHAPFPTGKPPGGAFADFHDQLDVHCHMSYNDPRTYFCGFCLLRLRGWDATALDKDGSKNTKT
jgi:hypothetical protein